MRERLGIPACPPVSRERAGNPLFKFLRERLGIEPNSHLISRTTVLKTARGTSLLIIPILSSHKADKETLKLLSTICALSGIFLTNPVIQGYLRPGNLIQISFSISVLFSLRTFLFQNVQSGQREVFFHWN